MKNCLAILFNDIDKDSRVKRALTVLLKRYSVTLATQRKSTQQSYPYRVISFGNKTGRLNQIFFSIYVLFIGLRGRYDIVYCGGLVALIPGTILKIFKIDKLIYDNRELYLKDENGESTYGEGHRFIEKTCIRHADLTIAANSRRAKLVKDYYKLGDRVTHVNNISEFSELEDMELPPEFQFLEDDAIKTIVYQGHLGNTRGLELFVDALKYLPDKVHLLLIARGKGVDVIRQQVDEMDIGTRLHVSNLLPLDLLHAILKKCDVGVIPYPMLGPNNNYCAPNKLYEYAQSYLPIISTPQQTFIDVFGRCPIGKVVSRDAYMRKDSREVAHILAELLEYPPDNEQFDEFNAIHSFENESKRLEAYLEKYV